MSACLKEFLSWMSINSRAGREGKRIRIDNRREKSSRGFSEAILETLDQLENYLGLTGFLRKFVLYFA